MRYLFLLHTLTFTIYITSLQAMFDQKDVNTYTNLLNQQNNETFKVKGCVLFTYERDRNKIIYTFYKQVLNSNKSSFIKNETVTLTSQDNDAIINRGKWFVDTDELLEYPDTLEMRFDPIKNVLTHYLLYKDGKIIFNIPSSVNIKDLNFYPTNVLENVNKTVYHNGWYPEKIYPNPKKDGASFYYTWQHKTYLSIKYLCGLLIVLYTFKKIKPLLPF